MRDAPRTPGVTTAEGRALGTSTPTVRAAAAVLTVLGVLPVLATFATRWGTAYLPVQDVALIDLRTRDVFGGDLPLVGVYSQFGWNHPGPLLFWLLAPIRWALGGDPWTLIVAAALLQLGAVVGTSWLAWRWGGPRLCTVLMVVVGLSYAATGPWILLEAWNPHVAYPFLVLFALLVWRAAAGPSAALAGAVAIGSFLVQTHVGYGVLVAAAGAWLVIHVVRTPPTADRRSRLTAWRSALAGAAVVAIGAWLGPIIDTVIHWPGNLADLATYFRPGGSDEPTAGLAEGLRLIAHEVRIPPPWLGGPTDLEAMTGETNGSTPAWLLVLVVLGAVGAWARGTAAEPRRRLLTLTWVLVAAGTVALTQVSGPRYPYLFSWRTPIVVLLVAATADAAWDGLRSHPHTSPHLSRARPVVIVLAVLVVAGAVVPLVNRIVDAPAAVQRLEPATAALLSQVAVEDIDGTVLVRFAGSPLGGAHGGIVDALDAAGVDVEVDQGLGFQYGPSRAATLDQADVVWYVTEEGFVLSALASRPGAEVVATTTPLDATQEAELRALQNQALHLLDEAGRADLHGSLDSPLVAFALADVDAVPKATADRLGALNTMVADGAGCRCAIVAFSPELAPDPATVAGGWDRN